VLQKCPECPETVPVCPGRSWKLLEGHGRFRKVPGSTTHSPAPLALGGKPPRLPWPAKGWGAHQGEGIPSRWKVQLSNMAGFRWEGLGGLGVQVGLPTPLIAPQGPLGHLYNVGEGWGAQHNLSPRPMRHPPSSKPRCSTIRPRFRRCSRSESVRVFSL